MSLIQISREQFVNKYDRQATRLQATKALAAWDKFCKHVLVDETELFIKISLDDFNRYQILEHLIQYWKHRMYPSTIKTWYFFVKAWIKYNGIKLDQDTLKQIKLPKQIHYRVKGIDKEIIAKLIENSNPHYKALFLVLACTGMRVGEAVKMCISWINFDTNPPTITIPGEFTKGYRERITHLTPEAAKMLKEQIKGKQKNDLVFKMNYFTVANYISDLRQKCGLTEKGPNGQYVVRLHKFRAFTESKISRCVGMEFAHAVIGHDKYLRQYFDGGMTDKEFAEDYTKAIPELTINDSSKLTEENQKLKDQVEDIGSLKDEVARLRAMVERQSKIR